MYNHLKFSHKKATQILNYFAIEEGGKINKMKALKLTFLVDRYHLRKYGRPVTNDEYFAMQLGPVASGVKDIAENSDFLDENVKEYSSQFLELKNRYDLISNHPFEEDVFSVSDLEALSFIWDKFGSLTEFELSYVTHQYPEWKKHQETLKTTSRVRMNLEDFFDDPTSNIEKCYPLSKAEKLNRKDQLKELNYLESLWS
ncbi:MAG: SocA family protein [Gammaproteobacteria bacterium]|nr:SocA family protein [Gammaproteobacteria bacterium]